MSLKAVLIVMEADVADEVARLLAATLTMNGYSPTRPEVIDWPLRPRNSIVEEIARLERESPRGLNV